MVFCNPWEKCNPISCCFLMLITKLQKYRNFKRFIYIYISFSIKVFELFVTRFVTRHCFHVCQKRDVHTSLGRCTIQSYDYTHTLAERKWKVPWTADEVRPGVLRQNHRAWSTGQEQSANGCGHGHSVCDDDAVVRRISRISSGHGSCDASCTSLLGGSRSYAHGGVARRAAIEHRAVVSVYGCEVSSRLSRECQSRSGGQERRADRSRPCARLFQQLARGSAQHKAKGCSVKRTLSNLRSESAAVLT